MPKADGGTFVGTCQTGEQFDASDCNQKIISARYFGDAWLAQVPQDKRADYVSPRDGQGHGTHTASTAAGNPGVDATVAGQDFGKISGVAPAAKIAVYKALWSGKDGGLSGGYASDILEAVDQAVADGVDVINFSVGFTALEESADDPIDLAFLNAADAGIFVAPAGANAGPGAGTLSNIAPWETTAAATTIAPHTASVVLGDGTTHTGYSTTVTAAVGPKPLVLASAVKGQSADTGSASLCMPGTLDPALTAGKIVVCDRGSNDRVTKSAEVARAGGSGMVLVNLTDLDTDGDLHSVPTVHLNTPDSLAVRTYAGTDGAQASLVPGGTGDPYPQVAGFSSRGPSATNHGDLLKPDIAAPGVSILAAVAPPTNAGEDFAFESGTSMATPHIAGLAALYLGKHPNWSPMKVKSAMMTTATPTVNAAGKKSTDPFAQGSGEVDPADMLDPGLVYDSGRDDWMSYLEALGDDTGTGAQAVDVSDLNYPSIAVGELLGSQTVTREVTAVKTGTYRATVDVPGFKATVKPSVLTFDKAGRTKQFTVTFVQEKAQSGVTATGSLTWKGAGTSVRSPIALTPQGALAPDEVRGTGQSGKVSFSVTPGFDRFPVTAYGLTSGPSVQGTFNGQDPERDYVTQVAKGAKAVEFNVRSDPKSSVLIVVFKGDITTDPTSQVIAFPTPLPGDSSYAIPHPQPGPYTIAIVDAGDAPGTTSTAFTYQASQVTSRGGTGKLTVSPKNPDATQGVPLDLTASWSGLPAEGRYTGYIEYPGGAGTVITVN
jgi:subtilisin family serine protease